MSPNTPWKITHVTVGLRLRSLGLPYSSIAVVLGEYHDLPCTENTVRYMLRRHGAEPKPRGAGSANLRRGNVLP